MLTNAEKINNELTRLLIKTGKCNLATAVVAIGAVLDEMEASFDRKLRHHIRDKDDAA